MWKGGAKINDMGKPPTDHEFVIDYVGSKAHDMEGCCPCFDCHPML